MHAKNTTLKRSYCTIAYDISWTTVTDYSSQNLTFFPHIFETWYCSPAMIYLAMSYSKNF